MIFVSFPFNRKGVTKLETTKTNVKHVVAFKIYIYTV